MKNGIKLVIYLSEYVGMVVQRLEQSDLEALNYIRRKYECYKELSNRSKIDEWDSSFILNVLVEDIKYTYDNCNIADGLFQLTSEHFETYD